MYEFMKPVKMVADVALKEGSKSTPCIAPFVSCLHSSELFTRCSACFRKLDNELEPKSEFVRYCSEICEQTDLPLHMESGENELFKLIRDNPDYWPMPDFIDLRLAIRLLHLLPSSAFISVTDPDRPDYPFDNRILGLYHHDYEHDIEGVHAGMLIALAKATFDSREYDFTGEDTIEIATVALVVTNAMKVHMDGRYLGMALYDHRISWLNHDCTPNAELVFNHHLDVADEITTMKMSGSNPLLHLMEDVSTIIDLGFQSRGPRVMVELKKDVVAGEEIKISYVDPYSTWSQKFKDDHFNCRYKFGCGCGCAWDAIRLSSHEEGNYSDENQALGFNNYGGSAYEALSVTVGGSARPHSNETLSTSVGTCSARFPQIGSYSHELNTQEKKSGPKKKTLLKKLVSGFLLNEGRKQVLI